MELDQEDFLYGLELMPTHIPPLPPTPVERMLRRTMVCTLLMPHNTNSIHSTPFIRPL